MAFSYLGGRKRRTVFLSYRRADSQHVAGRLYDRLVEQLGRRSVFMDVDSIDAGADFLEAVRTAISSCDVMLVLIGSDWQGGLDSSGKPRILDPHDPVAIEVGEALQLSVRLIPILIDRTEIPREDGLPNALAPLSRRNALRLSHESFDTDVQKILASVNSQPEPPRNRTLSPQDGFSPARLPADRNEQRPAAAPQLTDRTEEPVESPLRFGRDDVNEPGTLSGRKLSGRRSVTLLFATLLVIAGMAFGVQSYSSSSTVALNKLLDALPEFVRASCDNAHQQSSFLERVFSRDATYVTVGCNLDGDYTLYANADHANSSALATAKSVGQEGSCTQPPLRQTLYETWSENGRSGLQICSNSQSNFYSIDVATEGSPVRFTLQSASYSALLDLASTVRSQLPVS